MNILIIGGTRNIGYLLAKQLYEAGHRLTLLNRGVTRDDLPEGIARLRCDRTDAAQMRRALAGRDFDAVIDMVLYKGYEAETAVELLKGSIGHYVFISTGQVYLVRQGLDRRPFRERDYDGPLMPSPPEGTYDFEEWLYGMDKRRAEDTLAEAFAMHNFPYTSLRIPMVNGERDTFNRLYAYILRIKDGGPILLPDSPRHPVRHIYADDVVAAVIKLISTGAGKGRAFNLSQEETLSLPEFLRLLAGELNTDLHLVEVDRHALQAQGFLPDCSPFSDTWMSELDNALGKAELGLTFTPVADYVRQIVRHYEQNPPPTPTSYRRRHAEKALAMQHQRP
jgi:nucleoside-diphosphate-sugar epimerase